MSDLHSPTARLPRDVLWSRLARERQMTSLMEKEILPLVEPFARKTENWVPMWVDLGNRVVCESGTAFALRAITDQGALLWFVRQDGQRLGYHSLLPDPIAAIEEAREARRARKAVRQRWDEVEALRRDILAGRRRLQVSRADAYASPLCTLGIDGFMRRIGMGRVQRMPARLLALLCALDDQIGFVLWQAAEREAASAPAPAAPPQPAT